MSFMPSATYVAQAIFDIGADTEWENASPEDITANMVLARTAIAAIQSWQAQHRPDGRSDRYSFDPISDSEGNTYAKWGIYDKLAGRGAPLGVIHDALLAQQIVDDLNKRETAKAPPSTGL